MGENSGHLAFGNRREWRAWLKAHCREAAEAWLVIQKRGSKQPGLRYEEAVEEALCFGWIDGLLNTLDEESYLLRYTPRRAKSVWSMANIERVARLTRQGRMTEAGPAKVSEAKENGQWAAAIRREQVEIIPAELERVLRLRDGGIEAYRALPDSRKKQFIYWLQTAKRDSTKRRRVGRIVEEVLGKHHEGPAAEEPRGA